jgi:hypothetical protein
MWCFAGAGQVTLQHCQAVCIMQAVESVAVQKGMLFQASLGQPPAWFVMVDDVNFLCTCLRCSLGRPGLAYGFDHTALS